METDDIRRHGLAQHPSHSAWAGLVNWVSPWHASNMLWPQSLSQWLVWGQGMLDKQPYAISMHREEERRQGNRLNQLNTKEIIGTKKKTVSFNYWIAFLNLNLHLYQIEKDPFSHLFRSQKASISLFLPIYLSESVCIEFCASFLFLCVCASIVACIQCVSLLLLLLHL